MRTNQVEIKVTRVGEEAPGECQVITVYADSNNLFEALGIAMTKVINKVEETQNIPSFGCVEVRERIR